MWPESHFERRFSLERQARVSSTSSPSSIAASADSSAHSTDSPPTPPHLEIMDDLASAMGPTELVKWTITGADGWPTWPDALERLR